MSNPFYTNVQCYGNNILYRGINRSGAREQIKIPYKPTLFLPSKEQNTKFQTLDGKFVEPIRFDSIREAKDFIKNYETVTNFDIFGFTDFEYCYIVDTFKDSIVDYDRSKMVITFLDIEVNSENGFPEEFVESASEFITAITLYTNGHFRTWGLKPFTGDVGGRKLKYIQCESEVELLEDFLDHWSKLMPDAVSGWNTSGFDIPYLINRITRVLGEKEAKRLSPWGLFKSRTMKFYGNETTVMDITGISSLDYLGLYKKYAPENNQDDFSLDNIAMVELKKSKVGYKELGFVDLHDLYERDFNLFIEYNIKDVELVQELDDKMKLLDLVFAIAYDANVNHVDPFKQVRMWEVICFRELKKRHKVVPARRTSVKNEQYEGAHVKPPQTGRFKDVASFDLDSLYPSLMIGFNISPETLRAKYYNPVGLEDLLSGRVELDYLKNENLIMAANGHHFSREEQGFLPQILSRMMVDRVKYRKLKLQAEIDLELVNKELKNRKEA